MKNNKYQCTVCVFGKEAENSCDFKVVSDRVCQVSRVYTEFAEHCLCAFFNDNRECCDCSYLIPREDRVEGSSWCQYSLNEVAPGKVSAPKHSSHYNAEVQPIDLYLAKGELTAYSRSCIIRYAFRFGDKKGEEKKDIKKIIDCALLMSLESGIEITEKELIELIQTRMNWLKKNKK